MFDNSFRRMEERINCQGNDLNKNRTEAPQVGTQLSKNKKARRLGNFPKILGERREGGTRCTRNEETLETSSKHA